MPHLHTHISDALTNLVHAYGGEGGNAQTQISNRFVGHHVLPFTGVNIEILLIGALICLALGGMLALWVTRENV